MDPRRSGPVVRLWLRGSYRAGRALGRLRVPAGAVTTAGLLCGLATPVAAIRLPSLAALLVLLAVLADGWDGAVAVVTGTETRWGYVYDSLADRVGEAAWLVALWLVGAPVWLAVGCGGLSFLHEYVRARAVGTGLAEIAVVSVAERPTRAILAIVGLLLGGLPGVLGRGTVTAVAAIWAVLALVGLAQLLGAVHHALRA